MRLLPSSFYKAAEDKRLSLSASAKQLVDSASSSVSGASSDDATPAQPVNTMKASLRTPAHSPSSLHVQSFRVDAANGTTPPPQLTLGERTLGDRIVSTMAMNSIEDTSIASQTHPTPLNKHTQQQQQQQQQDQLNPSRTPSRAPSLNLARRASPMRDLSPGPNILGATNGMANGLSDGASDDGTGPSQAWSSAVGRATLGKSGRVIERLMADIDRLKRELNAEIQHRLDVEKREATNRATVDALRAENANLQQAKEVDAAVLKRRDRMIEDLRSELDQEKTRRERAQESAKTAARERDEEIAGRRQEVQEAREIAKHATGHAEVLEQSHRQLGTEYRQRCETFARDLGQLTTERDDEARKVKRLDVVVEQLSQEVEKGRRLNGRMSETMEEYVGESEKRIDAWRKEATAQRTRCGKIEEEAERVVGEARWLISVGKLTSPSKPS